MKTILALCFAITALSAEAQNILTPSAKSFEKKWITNNSYQMIWYMLKDTAKFEMGKVSTQIITDKNNLTVITHVSLKNMKSPWVDSTVASLNTLQPIRHSSYNMQRDMVLNFGKIVTGFYNDKMKKKTIVVSDTLNGGYFDSNLYPLLIGWLPLKNDYKKEIAIYDFNPSSRSGMLKAYIKDVKSGTYESEKSGSRNVWIVSVTDEIGNGENGMSTYYFDKADRKLWKQEIDVNGRKMLMKAVE